MKKKKLEKKRKRKRREESSRRRRKTLEETSSCDVRLKNFSIAVCVYYLTPLWIRDCRHKAKLPVDPSQVVFACLHVFWTLRSGLGFGGAQTNDGIGVPVIQQCQDEAESKL